MIKVEAITLEMAYSMASIELNCSITDLEATVVQNPSKGVFGFFKKNAVLVAVKKVKIDLPKPIQINSVDICEAQTNQTTMQDNTQVCLVCEEILAILNELFAQSCYRVSEIKTYIYDDQTITIEFHGEDSALLIGKEGHRYRALSYLLFNWVHSKYGYYVRLEVADFLKNQEMQLKNYLQDIIFQVKQYGKAQTKPLDSVLAPLALKELRVIFPNKYVALKSEFDGAKSVVVDEFWGKQSS